MDDKEIKMLKNEVLDAKRLDAKEVYWIDRAGGGSARRITKVIPHSDEPSDCAFLGTRGDYVALYNCNKEDFIIGYDLFRVKQPHIPVGDCVNGGFYLIDSRNFSFGVYNEENKGFIGIREKFGDEYLFTEYHWDTGPPCGTVCPKRFLEQCSLEPDEENKELFEWIVKAIQRFDES